MSNQDEVNLSEAGELRAVEKEKIGVKVDLVNMRATSSPTGRRNTKREIAAAL